jgi:CRP-like cAMP-binding protein
LRGNWELHRHSRVASIGHHSVWGSFSGSFWTETSLRSLFSRLQHYAHLDDADVSALQALTLEKVEKPRGSTVIGVGDELTCVFVISKGWAIRYRTMDDGRRQIVNVMLPGDCFDLQALINTSADHGVDAVTPLQLLRARKEDFLSAVRSNARLASAFWWTAVQEESILREQIVRLGRRSGRERIAHLALEFNRRLLQADPALHGSFEMPLSREMLADLLGLSPVHVSRSVSALRRLGLVRNFIGRVQILDLRGLAALAQFDPDYLHGARKPLLA